MEMHDQPVHTSEGSGVLTITLARPRMRNAIDVATARALEAAVATLDMRDDLRVAVLTGEGGHFCAGMDLKAFAAGERPWMPGSGFAGLVERPPRKPLIAAVEGYALAGGLEIALACDFIVASRSAMFGLPEVRRGLVAAAGGLLRLPARMPRGLALELVLTGRTMDAEEALRVGLVNRVVAMGQALEVARSLATTIAENAPLAVIASKAVVQQARTWSDEDMFVRQAPMADPILSSEDAREGALAFAQKRPAIWRGR